jgi:hypothetical protein
MEPWWRSPTTPITCTSTTGPSLEQRYALARFADGVLFSKDGRTLFVASGPAPGEPETIEAFDATTGVLRWDAAGGSGVSGFVLSPDGRVLAQADDPLVDTPRGPRPSGKPHTLTVLHAADGTPAEALITLGKFSGAAFAGPDRILSSNGKVIEVVDLRTRRVIRTVEGAGGIGGAGGVTASPDGVTVARLGPMETSGYWTSRGVAAGSSAPRARSRCPS